jgi:predicted deacylase
LINTTIPGRVIRLRDKDWLPCHDIGSWERAPRLALVANLHGNDLNGMFVLSRLAAFLRSVEAGRRRGLQLHERVVIVPTVDARRFARGWGGSRHAASIVTDRVMEMTRTAYYRVEVRTAGCDLEELPQVWLYAPSDDERASACLFGLPAVVEQPADDGNAGELLRAWRPEGGENFVIHAGQSGHLQTRHCETLFRALAAFLDRTGVIGGLRLVEDEEELHYFDRRQVCDMQAEQSGMFSSTLDVGRWVRAGEELGQVHDSFTGEARIRITAPVAGLLAGLRRQPLLCKGDLVARILAL